MAACEASRARLGVDQIDLYQIHMPDIVQPGAAFGYVRGGAEPKPGGFAPPPRTTRPPRRRHRRDDTAATPLRRRRRDAAATGRRVVTGRTRRHRRAAPAATHADRLAPQVDIKDEEYWLDLARCKELGLVKEIGVSNYGPTLLRRCAAFMKTRGHRLASNQIHYSLLARKVGGNQAAVDAANELGITTLAYRRRVELAVLRPSRGRHSDALQEDDTPTL